MGKSIDKLTRISLAGTFIIIVLGIIFLLMFKDIPPQSKDILAKAIDKLTDQVGIIIIFFFGLKTGQATAAKNGEQQPEA